MTRVQMSVEYGTVFEAMLASVASAAAADVPLVPFWPLVGAAYDGELLVIGRSVNGWVEDWTPRVLATASQRAAAAARMRSDAEPDDGCRMAWVTDLWQAPTGYNTARSAFWRVQRRLLVEDMGADPRSWSSTLAWTNLYKVSPAAGWNPGADLQRAQRDNGACLLRMELETLSPRRVLALTGSWINPFAAALDLRLDRRAGLVEGVGSIAGRPLVVSKHPMGKPETVLVDGVRDAFGELGAALGSAAWSSDTADGAAG